MIELIKREKFNTLIRSDHIVYMIVFVLFLFLHLNMSLDTSDGAVFKEVLKEKSLFDHMHNLYFNVNGKIFPDTMAAIFTYLPPIIFKVLNSFIFTGIVVMIKKVFIKASSPLFTWIVAFAVLLFPFQLLTSAGYVPTSTNYIWTFAALLVSLYPIRKCLDHKEFNKYEYIIYFLAALYAGNQEQTCAIFIIVYAIFIGYFYFTEKKVHPWILVMFTLAVVSMLLIMLSPGHQNRSDDFSMFSIPNYPMLNLFDKLQLGITSTISYFMVYKNAAFFIVCFLLAVAAYKNNKAIYIRVVSVIPLIMHLFFSFGSSIIGRYFPGLFSSLYYTPDWGYTMPSFQQVSAYNYDSLISYIPLVLSIIMIITLIMTIWFAFGNSRKTILCYLIIGAGFCSRIVMAFTPKLFGSSFRTFSFMYFSLIIICCLLMEEVLSVKSKFIRYLVIFIFGLAVCYVYYYSMKSIV